jgi:hypothetical protein
VFAAALQQYPHLTKYAHCIVMPAADRSLLEVTIMRIMIPGFLFWAVEYSLRLDPQLVATILWPNSQSGAGKRGTSAPVGDQPGWDQGNRAQHCHVPGLLSRLQHCAR